MSEKNERRCHFASVVMIVSIGAILMVPNRELLAAAKPAGQFPTTASEAEQLHEGNVDEWSSGPVQYIMLDEEREVWRRLDTSADRERFIRWFWDRRDPDLRVEGNPFRDAFYARVAEANERFRDVPRGWRSDRGRVWVILGEPDSIRRDINRGHDVWTYFTHGRDRAFGNAYGEMQVRFAETRVGEYEIWGGLFIGDWPLYLNHAFDLTNRAAVVDPFLEFKVSG